MALGGWVLLANIFEYMVFHELDFAGSLQIINNATIFREKVLAAISVQQLTRIAFIKYSLVLLA